MYRLAVFSIFAGFILLVSCEKCMKCSYTYNVTTIVQTINGEEEVVTSHEGWIYVNDTIFKDECIKGDAEFTIEDYYSIKEDTTVLDDYHYTCVKL